MKIKRILAIEFLTISTLFILATILYFVKGENMLDPNNTYYFFAMIYGLIVFIKLVIASIKTLKTPNSSK
jgi:multisubunit Na+/H+ antiporter MnhF subunit